MLLIVCLFFFKRQLLKSFFHYQEEKDKKGYEMIVEKKKDPILPSYIIMLSYKNILYHDRKSNAVFQKLRVCRNEPLWQRFALHIGYKPEEGID